jgi:hypothetical protein
MTKRVLLLLALVLALVPLSLQAQSDRDMLLTAGGTIFTAETQQSEAFPDLGAASGSFIMLTIQRGATRTSAPLPASLTDGMNRGPALAYDEASKTLFLFWQKQPNAMSSQLLLCSYQDGKWGPLISIDNAAYHFRENLRIGITTKVETISTEDGSSTWQAGLTLHAIWWDQTGSAESARYAMLTIDKGTVSDVAISDLRDFAPPSPDDKAFPVDPDLNRGILRHPALFESQDHKSVDVVFGDWDLNAFNRVTIRPRTGPDGRLRVPGGLHDGGQIPPAPFHARTDSIGAISGHPQGASDSLLFYFRDGNAIGYLVYKNGTWTTSEPIAIDEKVTSDNVIDLLRKMISSE